MKASFRRLTRVAFAYAALAVFFATLPAATSAPAVFAQDISDPAAADDGAAVVSDVDEVALTDSAPAAAPQPTDADPVPGPDVTTVDAVATVPPLAVVANAAAPVANPAPAPAVAAPARPTVAIAPRAATAVVTAPAPPVTRLASAPQPAAQAARLQASTSRGSATRPLNTASSATLGSRVAVSSLSPVSSHVAGIWTDSVGSSTSADLGTIGAGWARTTLDWSTLEPSAGVFNWSQYDQALATASAGGTRQVVVQVRDNPSWAAGSHCQVSNDAERTNLANFMSTLVARYRGAIPDGSLAGTITNIKFWQLYNEADNTSERFDQLNSLGGCFGTHDALYYATQPGRDSYAAMLEAVGAAIHAADPAARVVMAGLASGNFAQGQGAAVCAGDNNSACLFDPYFLRGVITTLNAHNTLDRLDEVAVHFYSSQSGLFPASGYTDLVSRAEFIKSEQRSGGLTDAQLKPLLVDEGSYTDSIGSSTSNPSDPFNVKQRNYVLKSLARAAYEGVEAYFWFALQDMPSGLGADNAYGLRASDGNIKPSYTAMQRFVSLLDQRSRFVGKVTLPGSLEGYEWVLVDGRHARVVWNEGTSGTIPYLPSDGTIVQATDPVGNAVSVADNTAQVGSMPIYLIFASSQLCRPGNVQVTAVPNGDGRLRVTLGAGSSTLPAMSLQFAAGNNALIDLDTQLGRAGPFTVQLASGSFTYTFYVRRAVAGVGATQTFSVIDGCGSWQTFVGGGPGAF